jgi:hypothetical protein
MTDNKHDPKSRSASREVSMNAQGEVGVAVDGFKQILEMLRIADPGFRESLLSRIAARDRSLAQNLRRDLARG